MPKKKAAEKKLTEFNVGSNTRVSNHTIYIMAELGSKQEVDGVLLKARGRAISVACNVANRVVRMGKGVYKMGLITLLDEVMPNEREPTMDRNVSAMEIEILRA